VAQELAAGTLLPGTLLNGRWRVESVLGAGGQATTYRGRDEETGQAVVIKRLRLRAVDDWKSVELFEREGRALAQLDHRGVPRYLDAFHIDEGPDPAGPDSPNGPESAPDSGPDAPSPGGFYLVQELIEGVPLDKLLEGGHRASDEEVRRLLEDVLEILAYLHGLHPPVVHRDIKPSNLIVQERGATGHALRYALVDFGAVQAALPAGDGVGSTIVGTAGYMAPEQLMGRAGPASDQYGLGATAIHMVTGHHPGDLPLKHMRLQWQDLAPGLDDRLRGVIERLTQPTPEARYKSAKSALRALRSRRAARPPAESPNTPRERAAPRDPAAGLSGIAAVRAQGAPPAHRVVLAAVVIFAVLAGLGFLALGLGRSVDEPSPRHLAAPPAAEATPLEVAFRGPEGLTWRPFQASAELGSYLTLTGTVRNDTGQPLAAIQGRVRAYDASGALVGAADANPWPSYRPALLPGESAPLGLEPCELSAPPTRVEIRLRADPAEASDASAVSHRDPIALHWDVPQRPGVDVEVRERTWREVEGWRPKDEPPVWEWTLDVTNTGQRPLTFLELEARGRDAQGQPVRTEGTLHLQRSYVVGQDPLPPGATTAVRLKVRATRPIHERQLYLVGLRVPR